MSDTKAAKSLHVVGHTLCNDFVNGPCLYMEPNVISYMLQEHGEAAQIGVLEIISKVVFIVSALLMAALLLYLVWDWLRMHGVAAMIALHKISTVSATEEYDLESGLVPILVAEPIPVAMAIEGLPQTAAAHVAFAADAGHYAVVAAVDEGFMPMARRAELLEFAHLLAEAESIVCQGGEGGKARLATLIDGLWAAQVQVRDAMCAKTEMVKLCYDAIGDEKASEALYLASFAIIVKRIPTAMDTYRSAASALHAKVLNEVGHLQPLTDLAELYEEAVSVRSVARAVMENINKSTTAMLHAMSPLKRMSRACEKVVLRPAGTGGAENVCDIVRDMFECVSLEEMAGLMALICSAPDLEILRFKDRIREPSNGWRDVMINYRVKGTTHVCELQISHTDMLLMRTRMGGHGSYASSRNARELLEFMGKL